MKKITFRELLNMIYDEKVPKRIIYDDIEYKCTRTDYEDCEGEYLSYVISGDLSVLEMACDDCIAIYDEILDDKEKAYLRNIIKPFEKYVKHIRKESICGQEQIIIVYKDYLDCKHYSRFSLPSFKAGTMYKGMELFKEYTLEELGL